jgi:ankyrin repeat protein
VFCQLEVLRQCLPQSVRRTLNELPESLDETYEQVMKKIKRTNQVHAYRMLQCLTVATRPLSVAELAELLAFDFDETKGGIPQLKSDWRWGDQEQAVLSTCSSLITIVPDHGSPVVQFSHFSVKEFLMSDRLAASTKDLSQYHISLPDAHTVLAKACLGVLLRDPDVTNDTDSAPLAGYAAEHWVAHVQAENVASRVRDGMEILFDPDKPYFEAWVQLHDAEAHPQFFKRILDLEPRASPLYYAALCGLCELVERLVLKYPQYTSALGGRRGTALHSASRAGHLHVVRSLLRHGVGVRVRGYRNLTPLQYAAMAGHRDVVQYLLDQGADVNSQDEDHNTPLHLAAYNGHTDVVRFLLEHSANANSLAEGGRTPLHETAWGGILRPDQTHLVRLLLAHGANANASDSNRWTPLHVASMGLSKLNIARTLLEHGADLDAVNDEEMTPLQVALKYGEEETVQFLSEFRSGRGTRP